MKIKEQREKDGKRLGKLKTWEVSVQDIDRQFSKKRRNTQAEKNLCEMEALKWENEHTQIGKVVHDRELIIKVKVSINCFFGAANQRERREIKGKWRTK